MALWSWSRTAGSNASADSTINWAEGQVPSSVNDSARAMMARTAEYRDDIAGAIATGGTSTAYTVTSYQVFDTLAHMANQVIAFTPHTTNGATVTLNVDGLGAKPLRSSPSVELPAATLVQGTPYVAVYNNSDAVFYLRNFYGNPYNVPIGAGMDYWSNVAPNSSFAFPKGQAISRTTYSALFTLIGVAYGSGDGSTTFNLPDKMGRVSAMKEDSSSRLTGTYFGGTSTVLNAVGGSESTTLTSTNQLPPYTPAGVVSAPTVAFNSANISSASGGGNSITTGGFSTTGALILGPATVSTPTFTGTPVGLSSPFRTVQPTIICNYIMRII